MVGVGLDNHAHKTSYKKMFLLDERLYNKLTKNLDQTDGGDGGGSNENAAQETETVVPSLTPPAPPPAPSPPPPPPTPSPAPAPADNVKLHANDVLIQPEEAQDLVGPVEQPAEESSNTKDVTPGGQFTPAKPPNRVTVSAGSPGSTSMMEDTQLLKDKATAVSSNHDDDNHGHADQTLAGPVPTAVRPQEKDACVSRCQICGKEVSNLTNLKQHFELDHQQDTIQKYPECKLCEAFFPTKVLLSKHVERVHGAGGKRGIKRKHEYNADDADDIVIEGDGDKVNVNNDTDDDEDAQIVSLIDNATSRVKRPVKKRLKPAPTAPAPTAQRKLCKVCGKAYKFDKTLNNHMIKAHGVGASSDSGGQERGGPGPSLRPRSHPVSEPGGGSQSQFLLEDMFQSRDRAPHKRKLLFNNNEELTKKLKLAHLGRRR